MRFWGKGAFLILTVVAFAAPIANADTDVRVRIKKNQNELSLTGYNIKIKNRAGTFPSNSLWVGRKNGKWSIIDRSLKIPLAIDQKQIQITGENLLTQVKRVPNTLILNPTGQNTFDVIGKLQLKDYLWGVLPAEMPMGWHVESLKAQAVASRSYALYVKNQRKKMDFHLESDVMDQMYEPFGETSYQKKLTGKLTDILNATEDTVLLDNKNSVIKAHYHSDCGGQTEETKKVWNYGFSAGVAKDSFCAGQPHGSWNLKVSHEAIKATVISKLQLFNPGELLNIRELSRTASGRIDKLQLIFSRHPAKTISASDFRGWMGYDKMKSTRFELARKGDEFEFKGRGFGHGVGLCQWGSRHLAEEGKTFEQILAHYYPKAKLSGAITR